MKKPESTFAEEKIRLRAKDDKRWLKRRYIILPFVLLMGLLGAAAGGLMGQELFGAPWAATGANLGMIGGVFVALFIAVYS